MIYFRLGRHALGACAAVGILAGCSGSLGQTRTIPQATASRVRTASTSEDCPALSGGTGILPDGDFSQATNPGDAGPVYDRAQAFAPDWVVNKGTINFDGTGIWYGVLGDYCSVDLDGNTAGGIRTKPFRTKPGASYTLSFVLSGVGGTRPTVKKVQISIDDREFNVYSWDCAGGNRCSTRGLCNRDLDISGDRAVFIPDV